MVAPPRDKDQAEPRAAAFGAAGSPATVSVIVAARPAERVLAPVAGLESWRSPCVVEVLVARGESPPAQRNAAAREASGDLLVFFDNDSVPSPRLIDLYLEVFRGTPQASAVGGPSVYTGGSLFQRLLATVFADPLVTGRSASRYAPRGTLRAADERELILANLAVLRSDFEATGGFDERFYPSEENVFLDRLRSRGGVVLYAPTAVVTRVAPATVGGFVRKVFRYGCGRAAQAKRGLSRASAVRILGALVATGASTLAVALLGQTPLPLGAMALGFLLCYATIAARSLGEGLPFAAGAGCLACVTHLVYASGILAGLVSPLPRRDTAVDVEKQVLGPAVEPPPT